jgi:hypothetical protein
MMIGEVLEPAEKEPDSWENITPLQGSPGAIEIAVVFVSEYEVWNMTL